MSIAELSKFQLESLQDCANSLISTYMLIRPNAGDTNKNQRTWIRNNRETDELISMGLLTDASKEFAAQIDATFRESGRVFRVLKITDQGRAMFYAPTATHVN